MTEKLRRILPVVAVAAALTALLTALIVGPWLGQRALLVDTGETRRAVETTLVRLTSLHPPSIDDPALRQAIVEARDDQYVAYTWLFAADGRVLEGSPALADATVARSATDEMRRVLGILPAEALDDAQRTALLAAATMQKEGEHNDVFRHLLREVRGADGELLGWAGVTFDVSPAVSSPGALYKAVVVVLALSVALYWLSLPLWVWLDARARGERAWVWGLFVLLGNLVALLAYLLTRRAAILDKNTQL